MSKRALVQRVPGGFTLVEMMVVIAILILLVGVTLSVGVMVYERSEIRQTEDTLKLLDAALKEWEQLSDRKLVMFTPGATPPFPPDAADMRSNTNEVFLITELLDVVRRSEPTRNMIANIDPDMVHKYEQGKYPAWVDSPAEQTEMDARFAGCLTILDPWDTPIYSIHPGRKWIQSDSGTFDRDDDGTIRYRNENEYGTAPNQQVVFVSAGPDGLFGLPGEFLTLPVGQRAEAIRKARMDNIYSTPVTFP